ncbi:MAG: FG-GAP-like repeat-containing protein [Candidatus Methanoperedens sp.]
MKIPVFVMLLLMLIPPVSAEIMDHPGYPLLQTNSISNAITVMDINNDSIPEIIVAPNSRSVLVYNPNGNLLWKAVAGLSTASNTVSPFVEDVNGDGKFEVLLAGGTPGDQAYTHSIYIWNQAGTLLKSYDPGNGYAPSAPAYADGLILVGISGGYTGMYAYDMTGLRWQLPFAGGSERMNSIATGDLDGDGGSEAVLAGWGNITVVNVGASAGVVRWQKQVPDSISPVIINVSGSKVVVASGSVGTFAWDAAGSLIWSHAAGSKYYSTAYSSPAVSDLNNDGSDDVVIVNGYNVYAISGIDGSTLPGFPAAASGTLRARPAIYDINGDSKPEIIIGDPNGKLYIWDSTGALLDGFPVRITDRVKPMHSSPAVYDMEGDGNPEVVIGSATHLHVVSVITMRDTTPPVTADDADGVWRNSDVTVKLTASDGESGVAATYYTVDGSEPTKESASGNTFTLSGDGVYTIRYFSVDKAGNVEPAKTASNNVKIDKMPPSTTDNADGLWHNGSAAVTLTAHDGESGVAATYYTVDGSEPSAGASVAINGEGNHTIKYYSVDNAGNKEGTKEVVVSIDRTPPVTTDDSDSMWHNSAVTLNLAATDSLSGTAFMWYKSDGTELVSYSSNIKLTFTEEGVHEVEYYAVDNAGNAGEVKRASVKIDKTPPSTADDSDGKWHNGSVTVRLAASDNLAGVQTTSYKVNSDTETAAGLFLAWLYNAAGLAEAASQGDDVYLPDEGVFSIQYNSIDNANNIETEKTSKQVKIDKTVPIIAGASTTLPNDNGWYNNDVTVHFTASDALSGIELLTPDQTLSDDGAFQSVTGTAVDKAGNNASITITDINIDKTAPTITGSRASPNAQGWYNTDVAVHFECSDGLSGLESCTPDRIVSTEGTGQTVNGAAVDNAGNSAKTVVEGINVDKTRPGITVTSPQNKTYLHSDIITLGFKASDVLSGPGTLTSVIDSTRQVSDGQTFDMLELSFGAHEFYIGAEDNAGNSNSQKVMFNVVATIDSLQALTERGSSGGGAAISSAQGGTGIWITNNGVANSLKAKLNSARAKIDAGQKTAAKNILEAYVNEVEAQTGKAITSEGAVILIAEARGVIENM